MADDSKKGPVKPPIIDAKPTDKADAGNKPATASSRPNPKTTPNASTAAKADGTKPTSQPTGAANNKPSSKQNDGQKTANGFSLTTLIVASIVGGALGIGGTSFMALNGISPFEKAVPSVQFNTKMEALQKRVYDLENAPKADLSTYLTADNLSAYADKSALDAATAQMSAVADQVAQLQLEISELSSAEPTPTSTIDPAVINSLQSELDGLKASILELSPDNSRALEAQLEQNQKLAEAISKISALETTQSGNKDSIATLASSLAELKTGLAEVQTAMAQKPAPVELPATANLPLIIDAWENALRNGTPYADFVIGANAILPNLQPSEEQLATAENGVSTIAALQSEFSNLIPQMVKSNAELPDDAAWYDKLAAQVKSAIGLRPLDQTGSDPLALIARIEAALKQQDLAAARSAFSRLPENLKSSSGQFEEHLNGRLGAEQLLAEARQAALKIATTQGATQ
ncbi:COG4223 family protein [Maritalea porphyrae]|uniref:Mitochondrial inner membrane protein n=1 Tax=Maritalea porphyrae TaxID=880732 RepID=A0ABQ5UQ16_9HYPH|nr:hypothetical protein [Maritalea porphyrae]GLQ16703.1 hypothetical protein GCM10007879_09520 [Maritalea porphyrae]